MRVRANCMLGAEIDALFGFGRVLQADGLFARQVVGGVDFLDHAQCRAGLVFDFFFGQLFLIELDDFLDGAAALAQLFAGAQQFLDDDGRARNRFQHQQMAALDALGDGHFLRALEQRHGAHLAQIQAHGVFGFAGGTGSQIQFDFVFGRRGRRRWGGRPLPRRTARAVCAVASSS